MPKRTSKRGVTVRELFTPRRHPRAPLAIQDRAALWLDLYVEYSTCILSTREGLSSAQVIEHAEDLANRSLDAFEKRWPTAEIPG